MQKIKIHLENCYGIKALKAEFDFSRKRPFVIYAANGTMKTSFAQTFKDLSEGTDSTDRIFKDRKNKRIIKDENGTDLTEEQIFVVVPYDQDFKSAKISTLLVNKNLKEEYDQIHLDINEKKELLIKDLKISSGLKNDIEEILSDAITHDPKEFYLSLSYTTKNRRIHDKQD